MNATPGAGSKSIGLGQEKVLEASDKTGTDM